MDIELDVDRSLVILAGERFPAVGVLCPIHESQVYESDGDRILGDTREDAIDVYVPSESGALFNVELRTGLHAGDGLRLGVYHRRCELDRLNYLWLPSTLVRPKNREVFIPYHQSRYAWDCDLDWLDCEPWWVAEQLARFVSYPVMGILPDGPEAELISLRRTAEIWEAVRGGT